MIHTIFYFIFSALLSVFTEMNGTTKDPVSTHEASNDVDKNEVSNYSDTYCFVVY